MPIHPDTLKEFEESEREDLYLLSHYPELTDDDMQNVATSILKKHQNTGGKVNICLNLGDNRITDVGINLLSACSKVSFRFVNLGGNPLSDASIPTLCSLQIQSLDLSGNPITDRSISSILESNIQQISLRGTKVTEKGILRLLESQKIQSIYINREGYSAELVKRVESFNRKNDKEKREIVSLEAPKIEILVQGSSAEKKSREGQRNKKSKDAHLEPMSARIKPLLAADLKGASAGFSKQSSVRKDQITYAQAAALSLKKDK